MLFEQVLLNQLLDTFDLFANSNQLHWTFLLITSQFPYSIKELKYCNSLDVNTAFLLCLAIFVRFNGYKCISQDLINLRTHFFCWIQLWDIQQIWVIWIIMNTNFYPDSLKPYRQAKSTLSNWIYLLNVKITQTYIDNQSKYSCVTAQMKKNLQQSSNLKYISQHVTCITCRPVLRVDSTCRSFKE